MRISSVRIQNFRCFKDETISFNNYTCFVGPNGSGKSTVLMALNVFFRNASNPNTDVLKLDKEDFHRKDVSEPILITITFVDLSKDAKSDLKDYFRQNKLIVSAKAEWNESANHAPVIQHGLRLAMKDFAPYFKAENEGEKAGVLKKRYAEIRKQYEDLPPANTKTTMATALREYEESHDKLCDEIPSEDQFYGVSKGADRLGKHIQWIFVPAVKDASEEAVESKKAALGTLLERTVRSKVSFGDDLDAIRSNASEEYQKLLNKNQGVLSDLSSSLSKRIGQWAHPDTSINLEWKHDGENAIRVPDPLAGIIAGEGEFTGNLARFGHGFQRSFILSLLEELSANISSGPRLILACEEPELYQHPPQARHLASIFSNLSTTNTQVMVCTHSSYFVSGRQVEDIRSVRTDFGSKCSVCYSTTFPSIVKKLSQTSHKKPIQPTGLKLKIQQQLQPELNEMFFTNVLVLVEGLEDFAYITTYLMLTNKWEEFRRFGCHIVPVGGKSELEKPIAIAQDFNIPTFVIFDSDTHKVPKAEEEDTKGHRRMHQNDNMSILKICGVKNPEPFPDDNVWGDSLVMWKHEIGEMIMDDFGRDCWKGIEAKVRKEESINEGGISKHSLFIGYCLNEAWSQGNKSPTLERLCNQIIDFAKLSREIEKY